MHAGFLGINGSGKSSLLRQASALFQAYALTQLPITVGSQPLCVGNHLGPQRRILAREDHEFDGELQLVAGLRVGYLEQEPKLDAGATVDENIRPALAHTQALLDEFEQACQPSPDASSGPPPRGQPLTLSCLPSPGRAAPSSAC